ncbi:triacylglycerol lipase [Deinococcus deserti]|uniref:Putative lipase, class 2 n=1 Tax=Deinococcus deserti (strain DSM 17065 / CIP 109153 / LMG 22923 / VCD115) TaxID=546414 RepID=C1D0W4_DEIDV|nr:triacylglycerol lipase [Deinococcus deserti]ACO45488.1 putative lipase, class 2 [Deinococcus deserti VCD115]
MHTPSKALAAALTATLLSACGTTPPEVPEPSLPAAPEIAPQIITRHPVLFVHGYRSSGSVWNTMIANFKQDGWTDAQLFNWSYDSTRSNSATAELIRQKVDAILAQTGAARVDIISHSMGGLSSRYFLKNLGGTSKVDAWVSLGGPNHGTNTANGCWYSSCYEMREGSSFLNSLNSEDETPGFVRYATWWSACDEIINPDRSVLLSGALNTQTACMSHSRLYQSTTVYTQVRDLIHR